MTKARRVVVTGLGVVAPNGHGKESFLAALKEGRSGISYHERLKELNFACQVGGVPLMIDAATKAKYFSEEELVAMNQAMVFACIAAIDAWRDAGLRVPRWDEDILHEDSGAIVGTGIGGIDSLGEKVVPLTNAGQTRRLGSTMVEQTMVSSVSAKLSGLLALGNQVSTNSCACSTGTEAIIMGAERIAHGLADRMVVGGAEGASPYAWSGFDALKVLNRHQNQNPTQASRPLSQSAKGFVPGSGSGVVILEELNVAKARGAKIYAELIGSSLNSGGMRRGGSMTLPSPYSVQRVIRAALLKAQISAKEVDYINGHLTATGADPLEIASWLNALELKPENFPSINSTKSMIGHALGAAGAIECIATLLQMEANFVHPSLNSEDLHEKVLPIARSVPQQRLDKEINIAAKASFGFGDVNSCVLFRKWREP